MKNYLAAVGILTGILIIFVTSIQFNLSAFLTWILFLSSPILICWVVWSVLTADVAIEETFDEQWYQDSPDLMRG